MNWRRLIANLSFKTKIISFSYFIILIISLILGFFFFSTSEHYIINKISTANLNIVKQINANLNSLQNDIFELSSYICISNAFHNYLRSDDITYKNQFSDFLTGIVATKNYLGMVVLYMEGMDLPPLTICNDDSREYECFSVIKKSALFQRILAKNGGPCWFLMDETSHIVKSNRHPKITLGRLIKNPNDYSPAGLLLLCINESTVKKIYTKSLQSDKEGIAIIDPEGNVISKSGFDFYDQKVKNQLYLRESAKFKEGYTIDKVKNKKMLIAYSNDNMAGWKIYYAVSTGTLIQEINSLKIVTAFVILCCLLFALPLMLLIISLLISPIQKLLQSMKRFQQGNFDEKVPINQKDEIGQLSEGYNNMVLNIKNLIEQNYLLRIKEREAELDALQAQINPHFLYNTLDTIFWRAQANGQKEIAKMIYSLSKLFRLSLNRGQGWTLVGKEKELLEHYLMLQKHRYQEKLNYEINIDKAMLNYPIPKLVLQPFVENAILHGLEDKENGGTIVVTGKIIERHLDFTITDNGIGMSQESIDQLFQPKENASTGPILNSSGGYAVKNVDERLKLIYKEQYQLRFTSEPGNGTKVEIKIPVFADARKEEVLTPDV